MAIDEARALFPPEPWGDLTDLNAAKGFAASDPDAPYQERWFPGTHGSVGGGGDIRGLSDGALAWVLKGAKDAGLRLDIEKGSRIQAFAPDPLAPLINEKAPSGGPTHWLKKGRQGPTQLWQVSAPAIRRWHAPANALPERKPYRPAALASLSAALNDLPVSGPIKDAETTHKVVEQDNLSKLARRYRLAVTDIDALGDKAFEARDGLAQALVTYSDQVIQAGKLTKDEKSQCRSDLSEAIAIHQELVELAWYNEPAANFAGALENLASDHEVFAKLKRRGAYASAPLREAAKAMERAVDALREDGDQSKVVAAEQRLHNIRSQMRG